jgi:hypothetical protein
MRDWLVAAITTWLSAVNVVEVASGAAAPYFGT